MTANGLSPAGTLPALEFCQLIGMEKTKGYTDAIWTIHAMSDSDVRELINTCSEYDADTLNVVAQSIKYRSMRMDDNDDDDRYIRFFVEAAPAVLPFYMHPKHRFNDHHHRDVQIGEWSMNMYRTFCEETRFGHHREFIRGYALSAFITGPSAPRKAMYRDKALFSWIGQNAIELRKHFDLLEERKVWDRSFLEMLISGDSASALESGVL